MHERKWHEKHRVYIGTGEDFKGPYSEHLARSKYCLVAPGDGWSPRAEDAVLHGCVPVIVMNDTHVIFETLFDWDSFSVRVQQRYIEHLPYILESIPPERLQRMQRRLARVWHRFAYASAPAVRTERAHVVEQNTQALKMNPPPRHHPYRPIMSYPEQDDALATIMQWLYARIPHTRGD